MRLYHWTKKENIDSILREGLKPSGMGIVYLAPEKSVRFGDTLLEVETGDLRLTAFDDCNKWEVLCWGRIPPGAIKTL